MNFAIPFIEGWQSSALNHAVNKRRHLSAALALCPIVQILLLICLSIKDRVLLSRSILCFLWIIDEKLVHESFLIVMTLNRCLERAAKYTEFAYPMLFLTGVEKQMGTARRGVRMNLIMIAADLLVLSSLHFNMDNQSLACTKLFI